MCIHAGWPRPVVQMLCLTEAGNEWEGGFYTRSAREIPPSMVLPLSAQAA